MKTKQGREAGTGRFQKIEGRVTKPLFARIDAALLGRLHAEANERREGVGAIVETAVAAYLAKASALDGESVSADSEDGGSDDGLNFRF